MTHLPLAFSIHHFISSVGADAGFASIIGLAILVLLYFAQARETSTLRQRADDAEQRAVQLEARVSQVAQAARAQAQQGGPRPAPAPVARPLANPPATASVGPAAAGAPAGTPAVAASAPTAPAGVGAPPMNDATHLIPLPAGTSAAPVPASAASPAPAPAKAAGGGSAPSAPPGPAPVAAPSSAPGRAPGPAPVAAPSSAPGRAPGPAPATAAAASAAASGTVVAEPDDALGGGGGNGWSGDAGRPLVDDPGAEPLPRVQLRPGESRPRQMPPLRQPPSRGSSSRFTRGLAALLAAVGVAVVIAVLLIVTSGGGKNAPSNAARTTNAPTGPHKGKHNGNGALDKRAVTVTVLNGTANAGLAAHVLSQLGSDGFKQGTATNAPNATDATSTVAYLQGQKTAALAVAKALKLQTSSVAAISPNTQSVACPQATCNADVVVTVGQDLAGQ